MKRAHIVQAVRQLHQKDADIRDDGEQKLAQIFRLGCLLDHKVKLFELGEAGDQLRDVMTEQTFDLLAGYARILDHIMKQGSDDGRGVDLQIRQDGGDFERVCEIGIAGRARLIAMRLHGVDIGLVQDVFIDIGIVARHPFHELELTHHVRYCLCRQITEIFVRMLSDRARLQGKLAALHHYRALRSHSDFLNHI